jgi:integrase
VKRFITIDCKSLSSLLIEKIDAGHITEIMLSIEVSGSPKKARSHSAIINPIELGNLIHDIDMTISGTFCTAEALKLIPNSRDSSMPMSKNVMTNRLRDLGYSADVMSAHGFRSTASTILHEQGWSHDTIEVQLAHLTGSNTSRAYNRAIYLPERKKMMQTWSDYLEELSLQNKK